jgi:plastocyanin
MTETTTRLPRHRSLGATLALGSIALALLSGCGDDDAARGTIEVTAVDFAFEDLPAVVPAGTTITLRNDSSTELHELVAVRIPDDEARAVEELVALPPEELGPLLFADEPELVVLAPPNGEPIIAVGDGTLTTPGRYAVLCIIPTGADPDAYLAAAADSDGPPNVPGGPPHLAHGMFAELVVDA